MFQKLDNGIDIRGWKITSNKGTIGTHAEIAEYVTRLVFVHHEFLLVFGFFRVSKLVANPQTTMVSNSDH